MRSTYFVVEINQRECSTWMFKWFWWTTSYLVCSSGPDSLSELDISKQLNWWSFVRSSDRGLAKSQYMQKNVFDTSLINMTKVNIDWTNMFIWILVVVLVRRIPQEGWYLVPRISSTGSSSRPQRAAIAMVMLSLMRRYGKRPQDQTSHPMGGHFPPNHKQKWHIQRITMLWAGSLDTTEVCYFRPTSQPIGDFPQPEVKVMYSEDNYALGWFIAYYRGHTFDSLTILDIPSL